MCKIRRIKEREYLVQHFKRGTYKALVAISCLDEGIDIPIADKAILMANSTNPREYIQRIGRVIRQANNKRSCEMVIDFDKYSHEAVYLVEYYNKIRSVA